MTVPGPKKKPANIHYLDGNPGKRDRSDGLDNVVKCEVPPCPKFLSAEAKAHWKFIVPELKKYGILGRLDQAALSAYCSSFALFRKTEEKLNELQKAADENKSDKDDLAGLISKTPQGYGQVSALWSVRNKAIEQMVKIGTEFGLTPSARARLKSGSPDQGELDLS